MLYVNTRWVLPCVIVLVTIMSCKKEKDNNNNSGGTNNPPPATSGEERSMDSVYLYSKEVYLWNDKIPAYDQFNPRQYKGNTELESAQKVMAAIKALQPLDRFSFVTTREESNGLQTGEDQDFGFFVKAASIDLAQPIDSVYWFVTYVYDQSTAGIAGVKRGWIINKINGSQLGYDQAGINVLNTTFFGTTTSANFEFIKPDKSPATLSLSKTSFSANSVLYRNVINTGGKKVGYLVFNQFFGTPSRTELGSAFNYFQSQGINELVVDLRYNPGGSTDTQDTLANLIAPQVADNQKMYTYVFNQQMQQGNVPLIKKYFGINDNDAFKEANNIVAYKKAGTVNLSRVFIIVSSSTASASELLINNLKPYMDVKLIGDTTYGKPVGFFPIDISSFSIYPISFKTVNSAGNADYYSGFVPDRLASDGVNKDWGDATEPSLGAALKYITTGTFRTIEDPSLQAKFLLQQQFQPAQQSLESHKFAGMFREK